MTGLNLSEWALKAPLVHRLPDDHRHGRRAVLVLRSRAQRGSGLHLQDHDRAGCLARRHARRHAAAGDRAARAQAAGDQGPRFPAQLHDPGPHDHLRQPQGLDVGRRGSRRLVPGPQEHRRHPPHPAGRRRRSRLQRRLRRYVRPDLRLQRRRFHPSRVARLRRGSALPIAERARRVEDRDHRRPGRTDLHRVLDPAAGRAGHRSRRPDRRGPGAEQRHSRRFDPDQQRKPVAAGIRRLPLRAGHPERQLPVERPHDPAARHRRGPPRLRRPAAADVSRQRQARHRPCHRHARRRRHPGAGPQRTAGARRRGGRPAARHRARSGLGPARGRRSRHRRVHGLAVAGHRHHHGGEHHQPGHPARRHRRGVDSADARHHLSHHGDVPHRPAAHLARRPDHRAQPAGRQRHDDRRRHDDAHRPGRQAPRMPLPSPTSRWPSPC